MRNAVFVFLRRFNYSKNKIKHGRRERFLPLLFGEDFFVCPNKILLKKQSFLRQKILYFYYRKRLTEAMLFNGAFLGGNSQTYGRFRQESYRRKCRIFKG
ncbi:MAG: hypothetical protein LBT30_05335 [Clostridiales bacterium]|jgi:hypothetical protein|nr:hypothetical protein [Clostridiales bacterium]